MVVRYISSSINLDDRFQDLMSAWLLFLDDASMLADHRRDGNQLASGGGGLYQCQAVRLLHLFRLGRDAIELGIVLTGGFAGDSDSESEY
jgi:hypothetical protein